MYMVSRGRRKRKYWHGAGLKVAATTPRTGSRNPLALEPLLVGVLSKAARELLKSLKSHSRHVLDANRKLATD